MRAAIDAIRLGAHDYLEKPFDDIDSLEKTIAEACAGEHQTGAWAQVSQQLDLIVGSSQAMMSLMLVAERIAQRDVTVLLTGETGTGKELLARFIHAASHRSDRPCFIVNCAALTESLLESELLGHERGAFTGAVSRKRGIFELANSGTLFLDEVADASPGIQAKLLRVLETGEFMRVGGEQIIRTNVRVIAATNKDLRGEATLGHFREDLLYRLDVASLEVPPLRKRREDLPLFLDYFLRREQAKQAQQNGVPAIRLSEAATDILLVYDWPGNDWPGNVGELANAMATAAALSGGGLILPEHLPRRILDQVERATVELHAPDRRGGLPAEQAAVAAGSVPGGLAPKATANGGGATAGSANGPGRVDADRSAPGQPARLGALDELVQIASRAAAEAEGALRADRVLDLDSILEKTDGFRLELARQVIRRALAHTLGNRKQAAELPGTTVRSLRYLLREKGGG